MGIPQPSGCACRRNLLILTALSAVFNAAVVALQVATATAAVRRVAVVGAGCGGLATANAILRLPTGVEDVQIFDQYDSIRPGVGGGVQINGGAAVMARLGLGEAILEGGNAVHRILTRSVGGRVLLDLDVPAGVASDAKYAPLLYQGAPMVLTIMRDRLQQILSEALPRGALKLGKRVTGVRSSSGGGSDSETAVSGKLRLSFSDGSESDDEFDLVVAADGVNSVLKAAVEENGGRSVFGGGGGGAAFDTGMRIQIGVAPGGLRPAGAEHEMHQWFGEDTYVLTATYGGIDSRRYEMIAVVYKPRGGAAVTANEEDSSWRAADVKPDCLARLERGKFPREVSDVAAGCERFFELGVRTRNPLGPWRSTSGPGRPSRLVLLGDAAHAMPPNLGQGANQALQDAYCLADRLAQLNKGGFPDLDSALGSYEARRKPVVAQLLAKSAIIGELETLPGSAGAFVRDNTFYALWKAGVASSVFFGGALPQV